MEGGGVGADRTGRRTEMERRRRRLLERRERVGGSESAGGGADASRCVCGRDKISVQR